MLTSRCVGLQIVDNRAVQQNFAGARLFESADHPQRGRFAAAGRAEQRIESAARKREGHVVDGAMAREILDDLAEFEDGLHSG